MKIGMVYVLTLAASWLLTGLLRRYAISRRLLDLPNERSSHRQPTPRGGGVAIVAVFLAGLLLLHERGMVSRPLLLALWGAGGAVAAIGFWDDKKSVAAGWRLIVHFAAAGWGLFCLGGFPAAVAEMASSGIVQALGVLYLVWLLNLYNFMDGIDGIAAIEAITVSMGGVALSLTTADGNGPDYVSGLLASAAAGFLIWNFPAAKIFMGDAGSGFLGIVLGLLSVQAGWASPHHFWSWLILLGVFIVDATVTLMRRLWAGEKVYQAHRSHAYQYAARRCQAHQPVSLAVAVINLLWLMPLALGVGLQKIDAATGLIGAYLPLMILVFYFNAGLREETV